VPIRNFEAHRPWVEQAAAGQPGVLTSETVRAFEPTSGSTAANKLIPVTDALLQEFRAALYPWIFDIYRTWPALRGLRAYWSISPLARPLEQTQGGIPIGLPNDAAYFGIASRVALAAQLAVPPSVAEVRDIDACRYLSALHLLRADDLGLISVWSPTFLLALLDFMARHLESLGRDLHDGTCAIQPDAVRARPRPDRARLLASALEPQRLWPRLALLSCWTSAGAASSADEVRARFPGVAMQGKGLLATEGVVSIPWGRHLHPRADHRRGPLPIPTR
jgi:hypothetical protein